ncbi:MAG TPA: GAF domain-containing protein [Candidatus Baltobacteraceae bacterium]|nr:GAF domain-containing protein [Candidatus Baltobacteraceae bacterium]
MVRRTRHDTLRVLFIVVFTTIGVIIGGSDIILPWHPYSSHGFFVAGDRATVTAVDPVAARSGIRAGNVIDVARMSPPDRFSYNRPSEAGNVVTLPLRDGRTIRIAAFVERRSLADNVTVVLEVLAMVSSLVLAAILVLMRPMPATWAFFGFSYYFSIFAAIPNTWPFPLQMLGGFLLAAAPAISPAAFASFALRFPDARPSGAARTFERILLFGLAPVLCAWSLADFYGFIFAAMTAPRWIATLQNVTVDAVYAAGIAMLIARYVGASEHDRTRLRWVVAAFACAYLPFLTLTFFWFGAGRGAAIVPVTPALVNVCQSFAVLAPIALAYTVLKHRLFDIRFVVSRALVYAVLMSFTVGVLALLDWAFAHWLDEFRFALVVELGLAVVLGVTLTMLHGRIEKFLNTVVFRAQTLALAALRRFAQETDLISDPDRLLAQTYEALRVRVESDYAAIYIAEGSSFVLATRNNDATPAVLAGDDFAVLRVRRWNEPFECDEPVHPLRGALLVPMHARAQLVGFLVCGPKRDRTHYLPEEVDTLTALAHRAGSSYAWLTMRSPPMVEAL